MRSSRKHHRKQIIVDPSFQFRIALWSGMLAVVEIMLSSVVMMIVVLTSVWIPAGFQVEMFTRLWVVVGFLALTFTALNIVVGVYISHRIAGPVHRLKESMRRMAGGDVSFLITLRDKDELQELKDEFNDMISSVRDRLKLKYVRATPARKIGKKSALLAQGPFKLD